MKKLVLFVLLLFTTSLIQLQAQDTLPKFSVKNVGNNRIIIGWVNVFETVRQISIQRSFDSLSGFKTILTVPDPTNQQNGYVDARATNDHMFYRLYIMLDKGAYLFSDTKRPVKDTIRGVGITNNIIILQGGDTMVTSRIIPGKYNGDSITNPVIGNKSRPNAFTPSIYVYTHRDGYVNISLPEDEKSKKYSIRFFDEDDNLLFELKEIKERNFKIDKTNFYHAGWFRFELYEDGKLFEKHKVYLEKDF